MGAVGSSFEMVKFEPTTPNTWQNVATGWPNARHVLRPTRYISYYPSARAVQGEYRPEVLTVRTERSEVCTKKTEGRYSPSTVPSKINKRFITRLEKAKTAKTQVWDHSGQCPVRYLENNWPAIEHFDWLILALWLPESCNNALYCVGMLRSFGRGFTRACLFKVARSFQTHQGNSLLASKGVYM